MSENIYSPPNSELKPVKGLSLAFLSILTTKKILIKAAVFTFLYVFIWFAIVFIIGVAIVLSNESYFDSMSDNMAAVLFIGPAIPSSFITIVLVLLKLKSAVKKAG